MCCTHHSIHSVTIWFLIAAQYPVQVYHNVFNNYWWTYRLFPMFCSNTISKYCHVSIFVHIFNHRLWNSSSLFCSWEREMRKKIVANKIIVDISWDFKVIKNFCGYNPLSEERELREFILAFIKLWLSPEGDPTGGMETFLSHFYCGQYVLCIVHPSPDVLWEAGGGWDWQVGPQAILLGS